MTEPVLPLAIVRNDDGHTFYRADDNEFGYNWRRFGFAARYHWDEIAHPDKPAPTVIFAGVNE